MVLLSINKLGLACVQVMHLIHTGRWGHTSGSRLVDHSVAHSEAKGLALKMHLTVWWLAIGEDEKDATGLEDALHL